MAYTKNKKQSGIGREYRGRKLKGHNKEVQKYIDITVADIQQKIAEEHDAHMRAKWESEGRSVVKKGNVTQGNKQEIVRQQEIQLPDKRFDHPGLYEGTSKYTPADKIAALTAWLVTGSAARAEVHCGVPAGTINTWKHKSEWWPAIEAAIKKEKNDEMEAMLTGILHQSLDNITDKLENGDTFYDTKRGETYQLPVKAKELAALTGILFDKRALMRGDPTRRVENTSTEQRLDKLKKEFEKFSKASTIEGEVVVDD